MADKLLTIVDASGCSISGQYMVDGLQMPPFIKPPDEAAAIVRNVQNMKVRDDDVMLVSYPKSGRVWLQTFRIRLFEDIFYISKAVNVCFISINWLEESCIFSFVSRFSMEWLLKCLLFNNAT